MDYFEIQSIAIDPSLQFISKRDLNNAIGKNIFTIDLRAIQRKLDYKYPQASQLRVVRRFPNQISVIAKQRMPFAQISIQDQIVILDKESVALSLEKKKNKDLPEIVGARISNSKLVLGLPTSGSDIKIALRIIRFFEADQSLSAFSIGEINVENLSKIYLKLSNDLEIFLDREQMAQKIRALGVILSQSQLDMGQIKYIDLRFKEPVIGKK